MFLPVSENCAKHKTNVFTSKKTHKKKTNQNNSFRTKQNMGRIAYCLSSRAGRVRNLTPPIPKQENKPKAATGRKKKRIAFEQTRAQFQNEKILEYHRNLENGTKLIQNTEKFECDKSIDKMKLLYDWFKPESKKDKILRHPHPMNVVFEEEIAL